MKYRIAGKFGEHYIWRISQWKNIWRFKFGDDLPAGLALRLSSCTYIMFRYRYACTAIKDWRVLNLTTLTNSPKLIPHQIFPLYGSSSNCIVAVPAEKSILFEWKAVTWLCGHPASIEASLASCTTQLEG